ncbi:MAG: serine/threonine protein kinase [Myxococcales bacterium]|nr:serine/threonine protein kinase [Myxococcales bacterium]
MEGDPTGTDEVATEIDGGSPPTVLERPRPPARPSGVLTPAPTPAPLTPTAMITTAAQALEDEELKRTRMFIRIAWVATAVGLTAVPFVESARWMDILFVAALLSGLGVSVYYHHRFADPRNFGPGPMFVLGITSAFNASLAVLFFGAFTVAPIMLVMGLHFIGRSDLPVRRAVWLTAAGSHAAITLVLILGIAPDPGVFATSAPLGIDDYVLGAIYVQGAYAIAYYTGRAQREVSLKSIEQLQRATRIAAQRAAVLDELRVDLARAQQAGAGRLTDETLGGFKLGAVIGRGAYGEVYEASGPEAAAVKVLHVDHGADPMVLARFLREANATASIASPHVVRVLATSEPGAATPFLAMERLRGTTLADLLRRLGKLPLEEAIALVEQVGSGLDAARVAGIVHRDLKPQNLMVVGDTWKIMDFGVAALVDAGNTLTAGGIVGTPQFMAPEQAKSEKVDHRTDLYALGAIAYRAVTGRNAFGGPDTPAILYAVVHTMPIRPSALSGLHPDIDRWCAIALAKDPAARFGSGFELSDAFAAAIRGELPPTDRARGDALAFQRPWQEPT